MSLTAFTTEKQDRFFDELSQCGIIGVAARAANISRTTIYTYRDSDPVFAQRLKDALQDACDRLEAEMYRRAVVGTEEDNSVFYKGVEVKNRKVKHFSDTLAIFIAKALMPDKYRETYDIKIKVELDRILTQLLDALRGALTPTEYDKVIDVIATLSDTSAPRAG